MRSILIILIITITIYLDETINSEKYNNNEKKNLMFSRHFERYWSNIF